MSAPATATPTMEIKSSTASLLTTNDDQGVVEVLVSVTGVVDLDNDIIVPGAYARTLAERRPKGIRNHRWDKAVSRAEAIEEWLPGDERLPAEVSPGVKWPAAAGALFVRAQYNMKTQAGRDAYEDAKFFSETGDGQWSIGYNVPKGKGIRDATGTRRITDIDLYEWSDVLHGAAPLSRTLTTKDAALATEEEPEVEEPGTPVEEQSNVAPPVPEVEVAAAPVLPAEPVAAAPVKALTGFTVTPLETTAPAVEGKMLERLPGSYEDIRDRVQSAVTAALSGPADDDGDTAWWVMTVGTWPDRVVVTRYADDTGEQESYSVPYSMTGDTVALGVPQPVQIQLTVEPIFGEAAQTDLAAQSTADILHDATVTASLAVSAGQTKAGRMLSGPNATKIRDAVTRLLEVLKAAGVETPAPAEDTAPAAAGEPAAGKTSEPTTTTAVTMQRADIDTLLADFRTASA